MPYSESWALYFVDDLHVFKSAFRMGEGRDGRSFLSPKKASNEEVDPALLFQSWAGDMDLSGKSWGRRERAEECPC